MMRYSFMVAAALAAMVSPGPAAAQTPIKLDPKAPPSPAIWRIEGGDLTHYASGLQCPATLGDLKRINTLVYDGVGLNVSCGYEAKGMAATIYAVAGNVAERDFEGSKLALASRKDLDAKLIAEDRQALGGLDWRRAAYSGRGNRISEVWVAQTPKWSVKYRLTYTGREPATHPAPVALFTNLVGSSIAPNSVACTGTAPKREGKISMDVKTLIIASAATLRLEGVLATDQTMGKVHYCVDQTGQFQGKNVVLLRGAYANGGDALVDRAIMQGEDTALTSRWNPALDRSGEKATKMEDAPFWVATTANGDKYRAYAVFDGRPDLRMLAVALHAIGTKQIPVVQTYDHKAEKYEGLGIKPRD